MHNTILVDETQKKRVLTFGLFGLMVFLGGFAVFVHAWNVYTEKREVLLTTSFKIGGQEQKFRAFYLSAPVDWFEVKLNVSSGTIKFSPWAAQHFEDSLGYFESRINETTVEKIQFWFLEGNNETIRMGGDPEDVNQVWYLHFYNEDPYEKEVNLQVTKVWT
jgi:hypothetical protein